MESVDDKPAHKLVEDADISGKSEHVTVWEFTAKENNNRTIESK